VRAEPAIVEQVAVEPLHVPLREPFVIATARMESTRAALVRVRVRAGDRTAEGLGEAAPLFPVTREDWPEVGTRVLAAKLADAKVTLATLPSVLDATLADVPVARAGVEAALLDAMARLVGQPVCALLAPGPHATELETDVTLPIAGAARMTELARAWRAEGFSAFKVKVGKDLDEDVRALRAVAAAVPDARLRLDANGGYSAREALALLAALEGVRVECFEQPCPRDDLEGMARVTREAKVPVVADESARTLADLDAIVAHRLARGVNLKLAKHGGLLAALELGRRARAAGLSVMCGAMVETRLGLVTMAHVVAALGGADFVDLDTAFLLAEEPFDGGWSVEGPRLRLALGEGLGLRLAGRR
jgi:o-succinylbenzoate synthase